MADEKAISGWDVNSKLLMWKNQSILKIEIKQNRQKCMQKFICDGLREGDVPDNLKKLYVEAVYGTNAKVKNRIIKRIYAIGQKTRYDIKYCCFLHIVINFQSTKLLFDMSSISNRDNQCVRDIDMMHAADYGSMKLGKLLKTVGERKKRDRDVDKLMRFIFP